MTKVVTDSSVWISFLRGQEDFFLETAMQAGTVFIPILVKMELLGQVIPAKERRDLRLLLDSLPTKSTSEQHFMAAAELKAKLESTTAISLIDAQVLQTVRDENALLHTQDLFLFQIASNLKLKTSGRPAVIQVND